MAGGYQGYGGQNANQQQNPYGQQQLQEQPPEGKLNARGEEEFFKDGARDCRCTEKGGFGRVDNWCITACCFGGLLCLISTFVPSWRVDPHGTSFITQTWNISTNFGFESKSYGVYHVRGSWSQSWTTLAQAACDLRNLAQIMGIGEFTWNAISGKGGDACDGSESCNGGFGASMHQRCTEYQSMMRISMVTLTGTFMSFVLIIAGTLIVSMSKRRKSGGIAFGFYLFASIVLCITNITWVVVTDNAFKNLAVTSWYPYPSLGVGFYIHTVGYATVIIFDVIFGYIVMPDVWAFDGAQEKLDKKKAKLEKRKQRDQKYAAKREELKAMVVQRQHFPQPPGMGWRPWAGQGQGGYQAQPGQPGYGQPGAPQPVPLGFQSDQPGQTYGQGGAQPAPAAGDFGVGAPQNAPGGAPAPLGFGGGPAPPPLGFGGGPAQPQPGGYGASPAGSPQQGGYGAPQQGYVAPPAGAAKSQPKKPSDYNWPAFQGDDQPRTAPPAGGSNPWNTPAPGG